MTDPPWWILIENVPVVAACWWHRNFEFYYVVLPYGKRERYHSGE